MNTDHRPRVVLYNPRAVFFTMPLALVAVASALDRRDYEVEIIDGRLEADPVQRVLAATEGACVLGITALTGGPLRDALAVSRAVKARFPQMPIVWGGWHPSLFPTQTLAEASVDVTVQGQGEETFRELVGCLRSGRPIDGVAGISYREGDRPVQNRPRSLIDMGTLPAHDYDLLPVERYFELKKRRQLDYVSSTGCPFRCDFCADPFVYGRKWVAIGPERVVTEIDELQRRFGFGELAFQDETFFTYRDRVAAVADGLLSRGVEVKWTATLRADQAERVAEEVFASCVESGLDRVMIGVESGSQEMLDWMRKDVTIEQVVKAAELCARYAVGATFPFIVGFPDEPQASVDATVELIKRLRAMSPRFETPLFFFKPYPGSRITTRVVANGYSLPDSIEGWADFDFIGSSGPWVSAEKERFIDRFKFYNHHAWGPETWKRRPLQMLSRWRCHRDRYGLPWEKALVEKVVRREELS